MSGRLYGGRLNDAERHYVLSQLNESEIIEFLVSECDWAQSAAERYVAEVKTFMSQTITQMEKR